MRMVMFIMKKLSVQRRNEIAQRLFQEGNIHISELAKLYQVSTETIRKDLIYLEKQGIAKKSYGGAVISKGMLERPFSQKESEHLEIKTKIAEAALTWIPEQGTVFMDAGSTNYILAKHLMMRDDLTIVSNAVNTLALLSHSQNQVLCIGGQLRNSGKAAVGYWATNAISQLHIDVAFLDTDCFEAFSGPASANYEEMELKRLVAQHADHTLILADHTKFYHTGQFQFCGWEDITALITNHHERENKKIAAEIKTRTMLIYADI